MANVAVLVVAGGGSGGAGSRGGAGGAGGLLYDATHAVTPGNYPVTVGDGGALAYSYTNTNTDVVRGTNGGDSVFDTLTTKGGGGGAGGDFTGATGKTGGSGGGAWYDGAGGGHETGQGYDGGTAGQSGVYGAGGGGGAGGAGGNGSASAPGNGGVGLDYDILVSGNNVRYAGGGSGANYLSATHGTHEGGGGGGNNTDPVKQAGTAGTDDLGGGGGSGGDGGSGVVIIRYLTADFGVCTGGTKTTDGDYTVHKFVLADSGTYFVVTENTGLDALGSNGFLIPGVQIITYG